MERFCSVCGGLVKGESAFCPNCGSKLSSAVDLGKAPEPEVIINNNIGTLSGSGSLQTAQSGGAPRGAGVFSPWKWAGMVILCGFFGIVSIVLNIVWGFASPDIDENRRNFHRGMLIFDIILNVLVVILVVGITLAAASIPELKAELQKLINI